MFNIKNPTCNHHPKVTALDITHDDNISDAWAYGLCIDCYEKEKEHNKEISVYSKHNGYLLQRVAILERAFKRAIDELAMPDLFCDDYCYGVDSLHEDKSYHEEFSCEKDNNCDPQDCSSEKQTECVFRHFIELAEAELKHEDFETT